MPKDTSIQHILILGSGPIIIGQACEFDYSGSQASRAIREEGIKVSLLNDNPATIMTDPMIADHINQVVKARDHCRDFIFERHRCSLAYDGRSNGIESG